MTHSTVVLDPDGDMIIILRNARAPFAPMLEDATQEDLSHGDPDSYECDTAPSCDIAPEEPGIEEVSSEGTRTVVSSISETGHLLDPRNRPGSRSGFYHVPRKSSSRTSSWLLSNSISLLVKTH